MRATCTQVIATMVAGVLLALASPALAHADSSPNSDPTGSSQLAVGTSRLKNLKSGKYLQAASTANGARIYQQSYSSSPLQTWEIYLFDGFYTFENFGAGRNLGIDGASSESGAVAIIANGSSDTNQDWILDYEPYDGGYFRLLNRKSTKCLGISGGSTANGAQAAQFTCDLSNNQGWIWE